MFCVYTDPSPCPRLLPRSSVSELVTTCSDFLGHGRPSSSKVVQCACSKPPVHVVTTAGYQKWPLPGVTSDPSLGCSVNTILSGARTRILGQYKCKCAFMPLSPLCWWDTVVLVQWLAGQVAATLIVRFMGPTWGPSGANRTQVGPMLAPWTLLSGQILQNTCLWNHCMYFLCSKF